MEVIWKHCKQQLPFKVIAQSYGGIRGGRHVTVRQASAHRLFNSCDPARVLQGLPVISLGSEAIVRRQCTATSIYSLVWCSNKVQYASLLQIDQVWFKHTYLYRVYSQGHWPFIITQLPSFAVSVVPSRFSLSFSLSALIKFLHQIWEEQIFRERQKKREGWKGRGRGGGRDGGVGRKRSECKNILSGIQARWLRSDDDLRISGGKIHNRAL